MNLWSPSYRYFQSSTAFSKSNLNQFQHVSNRTMQFKVLILSALISLVAANGLGDTCVTYDVSP